MYQCYRTRSAPTIDGQLDEASWQKAPKSPRFIDVIGGTPGLYDTRAALLWDDDNLYIAFWCQEPFPAATITQRDGLLWFEND
ncbi:MAG: carbohydrate-binding family 9-like protein, partial [Caldilineaceae bacterium]|nr:carbohydrate-binding family 9-like protein [Caldilineaceae bacterium]